MDSRSVVVKPSGIALPVNLDRQVSVLLNRVRITDADDLEEVKRYATEYRLARTTYHPDAERFAKIYRTTLLPCNDEMVVQWMHDIADGMWMQSDDANLITLRGNAVFMACSDFPACVWSTATMVRALRTMRRFPSAAEVYAFLKPDADEAYRTVEALERIAAIPRMRAVAPAAEPYPIQTPPDWALGKQTGPRYTGPSLTQSRQGEARERMSSVGDQMKAMGFAGDQAPVPAPAQARGVVQQLVGMGLKEADLQGQPDLLGMRVKKIQQTLSERRSKKQSQTA